MKLRSQMLLAGALTLAVPLVGWQSVKQLYSALQQTRIDEQTLKVANMRLALSEAQAVNQALLSMQETRHGNDWYAQNTPYPIFVDGYDDDWRELAYEAARYALPLAEAAGPTDLRVSVRAARREQTLFLFINVTDDQVIYHRPPLLRADAGEGEQPDRQVQLVNGDSVELLIRSPQDNWQHGLFRAIAPGVLPALNASDPMIKAGRALHVGQALEEWSGAWVASVTGYQLEVKLPLPPSGSVIGLAVVDVDARGEPRTQWVGTLSPDAMRESHRSDHDPDNVSAGLLFHDSKAAEENLQRWTSPGVRARLFDLHGRVLADVNNLYTRIEVDDELGDAASSSVGLWDAILLRVFAFFVAGDLPLLPENRGTPAMLNLSEERRATVIDDKPITSRYVTDENDRVLGTLAPIGSGPRRGYLLFEANEEHATAYAGSQLARLFSLLLLVSLLAGSGLLIFAFVLSSRIRRLSREAQNAIAHDGRVRGLPGSDAQDEIGDLSRKLSTLLARSAAYTQYLEALSSRLSHELRTPLSVVRTSIENLDRNSLDEQSRVLVDRASGGAEHLGSIIKALVESTRLEQTVQLADRESIDLAQWLMGSRARYEQVYPQVEFRIRPDPSPVVRVTASPELLQQAFDKLIDNAVSFSMGGPIVLHLSLGQGADTGFVNLGVANQGEEISTDILSRLFEPLFSERRTDDQERHLGLGLYIVKMVAEAHGGSVFARNQQGWVIVGMNLTIN